MKGLKVRVPKNQVMIDTFTEFGAAPIPLPWADTPTALQTGTVEGADNGTSFINLRSSMRLCRISQCWNISIISHLYLPVTAS